jgi:mRNA interferase MazF
MARHKQKAIREIKRFEVYWVSLDPTLGHEIQKTRPCVIISPDNLNSFMQTVIMAPFTSTSHHYPFRADSNLKDIKGQVALDQMRAVDKSRLGDYIATIKGKAAQEILQKLLEMFAE